MVQTQSADFSLEIPNLQNFLKLLSESPGLMREAQWEASRRGLASFRREWLKKVPVKIKGREAGNPGAGARRAKTIGGSFRWIVKPATAAEARAGKNQLYASFYTESFAAHGLEVGGTVKPKKRNVLAIPIALAGKPNAGKDGQPKPQWKDLKQVMATQRNQYRFHFVDRGQHRIVYAQRRMRDYTGKRQEARPFPIFLLKERTSTKRDRLTLMKSWRAYRPEVTRRYAEEIDKRLERIARGAGGKK